MSVIREVDCAWCNGTGVRSANYDNSLLRTLLKWFKRDCKECDGSGKRYLQCGAWISTPVAIRP